MLLTKEVDIKINKVNIDFYKKFGYDVKLKDIIKIPTEHLSDGSHQKVEVKCDLCDKILTMLYQTYVIRISCYNFITCKKCSIEKQKLTNKSKYDNEYFFTTDLFKNKAKVTKIERYNDENYNNMDKNKNTFLEKYGVDCALKIEKFKDKSKETRFKKYGNENYTNPEKNKKTCLERYGVDNLNKDSNFRKKTSHTRMMNSLHILSKYGIVDINENNEYICEKGHVFKPFDTLGNRIFYQTILCPICNPINSYKKSGFEIQLYNFIKEKYNKEIVLNSRKIIYPNELDIYLPELKLAFEFNGLFWHNEMGVDKNYHLIKTEKCEEKGIQLIHIYEDDWVYKQEIVKSRILNLLGKNSNKIYGRKCIIKEINDNKILREFIEKNHLQGFVGSSIKIGLFYNDELVSLMTFGSLRKSMGTKSQENTYEMLRFCNKLNTSVMGGADKLFKYFIKTYKPLEVISYADRSWSRGDLYKKLGFTFVSKTQPNYYYIVNKIRRYRFNYRKNILIKQGYDSTKSEHEIMLGRKIYRIYDSGSLKFIHN